MWLNYRKNNFWRVVFKSNGPLFLLFHKVLCTHMKLEIYCKHFAPGICRRLDGRILVVYKWNWLCSTGLRLSFLEWCLWKVLNYNSQASGSPYSPWSTRWKTLDENREIIEGGDALLDESLPLFECMLGRYPRERLPGFRGRLRRYAR